MVILFLSNRFIIWSFKTLTKLFEMLWILSKACVVEGTFTSCLWSLYSYICPGVRTFWQSRTMWWNVLKRVVVNQERNIFFCKRMKRKMQDSKRLFIVQQHWFLGHFYDLWGIDFRTSNKRIIQYISLMFLTISR